MPCWPGKSHKKKDKGSANSSVVFVNENEKNSSNSSLNANSKPSLRRQWVESHPFETTKILENICSHLTVNELLQVRLVNKRFNLAACPNLREKIEGAVILQRGLSYYTRVMGQSLSIPVGRLFLKIDDMEDPAAIKFFQVVGPSILYLVLNLEGSGLASFLSQVHNLTNLKQLSLNLFKEENGEDEYYRKRKATSIKIFIEDYDSQNVDFGGGNREARYMLKNLESFVLSCEPEWKSNEALLLEKLIEMSPSVKNLNLIKWPFMLKPNLFQRCQFENLKFFSVKTLDDQGLGILAKKKLPHLKTFECEISHELSQETFQAFLDNVSNSLEYIELKNPYGYGLNFKLPTVMKELKTIRLATWVGPISLDSILNLAPRLEKLQLSHVNPADIIIKDQVRQAPSVNYLAINFGAGNHPMKKIFKTLKSFVAAFPNLKIFMMKKVSDKILEIICEGWPKLEALRITTSFALTDSGITGLPASGLTKIAKADSRLSCGCCVPVPVVDGLAQLETARVSAYISQLKDLQDLRIEAEVGTHWALSNLSLHLGINELRNLTSLKMTCNELGPHWCLKCIADNLIRLKHLTIMDRSISHDRYDEQELHYLLRKLPNLNLTFAEADILH